MNERERKVWNNFVVVGGGNEGEKCVEKISKEGLKGRIVIVCKEKVLN